MKIIHTITKKAQSSNDVEVDGLIARITTNKYGTSFLTFVGNTFPHKDFLKSLGFKFFQGAWGKALDKITESEKQQMFDYGIDRSIFDDVNMSGEVSIGTQEVPQQSVENPSGEKELTKTDEELSKLKASMDEIQGKGSERVKKLAAFIEDMINKVADMTDEAAQSEFIREFYQFAAKFHQYSLHNQLLIYVQNRNATYVSGAKKWLEMGRQVVNWDKGITIFAPRFFKEEVEKQDGTKEEIERIYFKDVKVYDIADTEPLPNYKGEVFEPKSWRQDPNEESEEINLLVNSIHEVAKELNIDIGMEEMNQETGGYSAGGKIRLNNTFAGINLFSTAVHELAHEILHWEGSKGRNAKQAEYTRQEKEIDAESTAFIVLKHFGFETKDSPNYLAIWKAKGEDVRKRKDYIARAAKQIINSIYKQIDKIQVDIEAKSKSGLAVFSNFIGHLNLNNKNKIKSIDDALRSLGL